MIPGTYDFYTIEFRTAFKGDPGAKELKDVRDESYDWRSVGEHFLAEVMPWVGKGNNRHPRNQRDHDEMYTIYRACSYFGWPKLSVAMEYYERLLKADAEGAFDYRGTYGDLSNKVRHDFRVVKVVISFSEEVTPITLPETASKT